MKLKYEAESSGIELVRVEDSYQLCTKKELHEYLYPIFDSKSKPSISTAALETLSIIAYNPRISRAEIESIRGVNSDGTLYKLLDYGLIKEDGKLDILGKPMSYKVTHDFMKMFGISSLDELPDLPRYRIDENEQIVVDDIIEAPIPEKGVEEVEENKDKSIISEENNNE